MAREIKFSYRNLVVEGHLTVTTLSTEKCLGVGNRALPPPSP